MSWMMEEFCNSWQAQENFLFSETCMSAALQCKFWKIQ